MRIVSLLPSATEILFALGLDAEIVGVSHDCDFPPLVRERRVMIHSRIPPGATSLEIDGLVREYVARGESVYTVDAEALRESDPDLIVTQDLCLVCAASPHDLSAVLANFEKRPRVLCLNPRNLSDVWRDISLLAGATSRDENARKLLAEIDERLHALKSQVDGFSCRPRVVFLEWLDPFYVGGHWIPEMIAVAGGEDIFGHLGAPSYRVEMSDVLAAAPEVMVIAPCGYNARQAREEYRAMTFPAEWAEIPAVKNGRVFAFEANAYASRPGPRLITGVEALAKIFHPEIVVSEESAHAVELASLPGKAYRASAAADLSRPAHIL
ncbi:MAG TPA: cobalamin-binding protein [Candidatus Acidoferrum sp.]|jgi:iron complex transport system substrate-binding protein